MNNSTEDDFGTVFRSFIHGCGSISKVVEHSEFQTRLKCFACGRDFGVFHGDRSWEDLRQDISLKLLEAEMNGRLQIPGNVRDGEDFFMWLFFVVRHHHFDTIRARRAIKRDGLRSDKPIEEYDYFPASEESRDTQEELLGPFLEFIKRYPVVRQVVIRLWLKNRPYRTIQRIMKRLGSEISHVTAGNWINAAVKAFCKSRELPFRQQRRTPHRRTGTR